MDKDLAVFFIGIIIFIFIGTYGANNLAKSACISQWKLSGFNSKYEFLTGCLVEVSKNKWIPENNYREVNDE